MTSHTVEARDDIERLAASRARPGRVPGSDPGGRPFNDGVDRAGWSLTRRLVVEGYGVYLVPRTSAVGLQIGARNAMIAEGAWSLIPMATPFSGVLIGRLLVSGCSQ